MAAKEHRQSKSLTKRRKDFGGTHRKKQRTLPGHLTQGDADALGDSLVAAANGLQEELEDVTQMPKYRA